MFICNLAIGALHFWQFDCVGTVLKEQRCEPAHTCGKMYLRVAIQWDRVVHPKPCAHVNASGHGNPTSKSGTWLDLLQGYLMLQCISTNSTHLTDVIWASPHNKVKSKVLNQDLGDQHTKVCQPQRILI